MSAKRKKRGSPKCSIVTCKDASQELYTCCSCKSSFHYSCGNLDSDLVKLLEGNTSRGLSWYYRCDTCVTNGVPDPLALQTFLLDISNSISNKIEEYKSIFNNSFLLEADVSIQNKIEDFKNSIKNSGMMDVDTTIAHSAVQVDKAPSSSVQTNTFCEVKDSAVQTDSTMSLTFPNDTTQASEKIQSASFNQQAQKVCSHYNKGSCRHGASGKQIFNGRECMFPHPKKCLKYCRFGADRYKGCVGPCDYFHPVLCKSSMNYKECLNINCTLAHLVGTRRKNTVYRDNQNSDTRYVQPRFIRSSEAVLPSRASYARTSSLDNQRGRHNQMISRPNNETRDFQYKGNDFPSLPSKEESKITQNATDINELRHSINYLMQNVASFTSRTQNLSGNFPRTPNQDVTYSKPGIDPAISNGHQAQTASKNYLSQNYQYQVQ